MIIALLKKIFLKKVHTYLFKKIKLLAIKSCDRPLVNYFVLRVAELLSLHLKFGSLVLKKVVWLDEADTHKIEIICQEQERLTYGPKFLGEKPKKAHVVAPSIWLYKFKNACVTSSSSNIISGDNVYLERIQYINKNLADYSTGFVFEHNSEKAIVDKNIDFEVDSGVFLGGNGSWNYYHWLIEILPKIYYYLKAGALNNNITLFVPDDVKRIGSFDKLLTTALSNYKFDLKYMQRGRIYRVNNLQTITTASNIVFNCRKLFSDVNFCYFRKESIEYIKSIARQILDDTFKNSSKSNSYKRIFLARKANSVREYNQEETLGVLQSFGFQPIFMEDLTIEEQITAFMQAEFIIGPSGAAWTNIIFCSPGTKALSWLPEKGKNFSVFSSLAAYSKVDMHFFLRNSYSNELHGQYAIDLKELKKALNKLGVL